MEGVAPERLDARNAGQLGPVQWAVAHDEEAGGHPVAAIGVDGPEEACRVPLDPRDLGGEAGPLVESEMLGDAPAVTEYLGRPGVLLGRDVGGLLE